MKKFTLLIVEDDQDLAQLTLDFFQQFEFECSMESNGQRALQRIVDEQPDLVLLDLMLPDLDGLEICKQVKDKTPTKIVMLTARTDTIDQVLGLEIGADDYVSKPVEPRLLLAKARAVLRREARPTSTEQETVTFGPFCLNRHKREVRKNDQLVELSTPEYDLLCLLIENAGEVVSRDQIFMQLRGVEYDGQNRQVDIHISSLRAKLEENLSCPSLIKTVRAKGYIFTG